MTAGAQAPLAIDFASGGAADLAPAGHLPVIASRRPDVTRPDQASNQARRNFRSFFSSQVVVVFPLIDRPPS